MVMLPISTGLYHGNAVMLDHALNVILFRCRSSFITERTFHPLELNGVNLSMSEIVLFILDS